MRRGLRGFVIGSLSRGGERDAGCGFLGAGCPRVARRLGQRRFTRGYILVVPSGLAVGVSEAGSNRAGPSALCHVRSDQTRRGRVNVGIRHKVGLPRVEVRIATGNVISRGCIS